LPLVVAGLAGGGQEIRIVPPPGDDDDDERLAYVVRRPTGALLVRLEGADLAAFPARPATGFGSTGAHRLYGVSALGGAVVLEIAEPLEDRAATALEASLSLFAPLAALIPLSFLGVWLVVRRNLKPVRQLSGAVATRGAGDLSPLDAPGLPAEIAPVADAVDALLARLRRALEAERSFATNSAHELRTPIAAALAQTQRLVAETGEDAARERGRRIEASLTRLARISEKLMQLARAEGGGLLAEEPRDLMAVLTFVADEFRNTPGDADRLRLHVAEGAAPVSRLDPDAFAILLRNLVENAIRHGDPAEAVDIHVEPGGVLRVVNGGPPVPAAMLADLCGRFARGGSEADGAGLGLAIVRLP